MSAYGQGLTGPEAAWASRKYHGPLPPEMANLEHQKNTLLKTHIYFILRYFFYFASYIIHHWTGAALNKVCWVSIPNSADNGIRMNLTLEHLLHV